MGRLLWPRCWRSRWGRSDEQAARDASNQGTHGDLQQFHGGENHAPPDPSTTIIRTEPAATAQGREGAMASDELTDEKRAEVLRRWGESK
jgi:hypothetical protein